jgi:hypothetical protein
MDANSISKIENSITNVNIKCIKNALKMLLTSIPILWA